MKLVVLDSYACTSHDLSFDFFADLGELTVYPRSLPEEIPKRIGDAELVITNKCIIDRQVMERCPNLRYIGITATGYNIIDLAEAAKRGIVVTNVPAYSTKAVAQQVFAYLLHLSNQVEKHHRRVMAGDWENCEYFCFYESGLTELDGKAIGLIGFGSIAKQVAVLAEAFGMKVLSYTRTVRETDQRDFPNVSFVDFDTLLDESDYVSIHCPLTPQTENLIRLENLKRMKSTAVLINTARGSVINESDLAEALNRGIIAYACVDVVSKEPVCADNPLLKAKNILITPHTAWAPKETRARLLNVVYENLYQYLQGNLQNQVN